MGHMSGMAETPAETRAAPRTGKLSRTRGAASGFLLLVLGAWGALAPFIGPTFNFAFTPDKAWTWTAARGWYEVLPGCVVFVGGLLLLVGSTRAVTMLGAWMGILGGAWFIVAPTLSNQLTLGRIGTPTGTSSGARIAEYLCFFYALGAVILFLASAAFGRLSVVSLRDIRVAERREAARREAEEQAVRDAADREAAERDGERVRPERYPDFMNEPGPNGPEDGTDPRTAPTAPGQAPAAPGAPGGSGQSGYHNALGYREGEQPGQPGQPGQSAPTTQTTQYGPPTYGRHDAGSVGSQQTEEPTSAPEPPPR
jgi:hypothetical protein